ncbi:helix-turn-helix domain-containing protein [Actinomadura geliboluensis]|uniref:helix-turn-helix domain-containing protein n=1 Tax=Actinomadura geliboluensis TaxID=882440 RepID=UPI0037240F38
MKSGDNARICHSCGARLARSNPDAKCAPCQAKARDRFIEPPTVPAAFWSAEPLRAALSDWHVGRLIRAYRHHPHHGPRALPQDVVARWLNITQTQLSRIESGPPVTDLDRLIPWARTLGVPPSLLWFKLPEEPRPPAAAHRPQSLVAPSLPAALQYAALNPLGSAEPPSDDPDMTTLYAFRAADRQVGGGHLYPTVTSYLQSTLAPRLFGSQTSRAPTSIFTAAGGFTEMAGWMAHDAGHDQIARRHFRRSLDLAQMGGDPQLTAHVYASMSHLSLHQDEPGQAIALARQGHAALDDNPPAPVLSARLYAMEARGLAALADQTACAGALKKAEKALERCCDERPSPWVSPFDAGSLASEAARCMRQLGELTEAERQARRIIELRADSHTRSRVFAKLLLVTVLIAQRRPDEACSQAREILDLIQGLSSHLVTQQLDELHALLGPYRRNTTVAEFLPRLEGTLRSRRDLYSWLSSNATRAG